MSALMQQHERWADARTRLFNGPTPPPKAKRERPISPFLVQQEEERAHRLREHKRFLEQLVIKAKEDVPAWRKIVQEVARAYGTTVKDILGQSRFRHIVVARQAAMYRIRHEIKVRGEPMSFPEIGRKFGDRDHQTVIHAIRAHERRMAAATGVNEPLRGRPHSSALLTNGATT